jgi:uncharacterized protein YjiS (DUF1127 family)
MNTNASSDIADMPPNLTNRLRRWRRSRRAART